MFPIKQDSTSVIIDVFLQDSSSTTGAGITSLSSSSPGLTVYYHRNTASSAVQVYPLDGTMTVGTWKDKGFKEVDATNLPGVYQLCLPDAAFANGATEVTVYIKGATNLQPRTIKIPLSQFDMQSAGVSVKTGGIINTSFATGAITSAAFATDGTAQAGTSTTITLDPSASSVTDFYKGAVITIVSGTGSGQSRLVLSSNGGTKVCSVDEAWAVTPDNTSKYFFSAAGRSYLTASSSSALTSLKDAIWSKVVETQGSYTAQQVLSELLAFNGGTTSDGGTKFYTPDGAVVRAVATLDGSNNRPAMTLTPSS